MIKIIDYKNETNLTWVISDEIVKTVSSKFFKSLCIYENITVNMCKKLLCCCFSYFKIHNKFCLQFLYASKSCCKGLLLAISDDIKSHFIPGKNYVSKIYKISLRALSLLTNLPNKCSN